MAEIERPNNQIVTFVENLMIREGGFYTLLGSKPMTIFDITCTIEENEEDIARSYENSKLFFEKAKKDPEKSHTNGASLPDFEEYRAVCLSRLTTHQFLNKKMLWEVWLKKRGTFSTPAYILTSRRIGKGEMGVFLNIPQMLHILKKHQNEFRQETGMEFEISAILDSFEDEYSVFWNKVCGNHYLLGLLLGYGEKNAYLFNWLKTNSLPLSAVSILRFPDLSRLEQTKTPALKKNNPVEDLPIPYFVSFEINDPEIQRYATEKEKIISFLKERDYIAFALDHLKPCLE